MLCLAILVGVLAFAGCKQKNNDETTAPPNTDAAIDNIVGDDTEPALENTTQSAQPGQPVQPAKPAQQVQPTKPASKSPLQQPRNPNRPLSPHPQNRPYLSPMSKRTIGSRPAHISATETLPPIHTISVPAKKMSAVPSPSLTAKTPQSFPCPTDCLYRSKRDTLSQLQTASSS